MYEQTISFLNKLMNKTHDSFINHYQNNKDKLFNYLMYRLNFDKELAEDILMDIVLKAYENYKQFNSGKGSFKNWIFTIAHNHLVNHWRDNKNNLPLKENINDSASENINGKIDKKMELEKVKKILSLMDKKESEIIVLKYINEFTTKEIAETLKKKENAVRTGLSRAIKQFKSLYNKIYYE